MTPTRRAYLAGLGTLAVSGCTGDGGGSTSTDDAPPATEGSPSETRDASHTPTSTTQATSTDTETPEPHENGETTIAFAGDTMVGRDLNEMYGDEDVDPASIWGEFRPRLEAVDGVFCNLECCLSTRGERFPDRTYYLRGNPEWAVPALTAGNVTFAALANNHAMDFGAVALTDTIDALDEAGIENAGTGETMADAWAPATFSVDGLDVAVVSFADEYEAYAATDEKPGIAWVETDPENPDTQRVVGDAIDRAKSTDPDLLVASVHWGENWVERPGDRLVSFGHWLVDQGVDVVHGHSAHLVQAVEQYGDGVILHDTGDLVDDFGVKDDLGNNKSYLFEVTLTDGEPAKIRLVPFFINDGVYTASEYDARWLRETMRERSEPFETTYERDGEALVVDL